MSVGHYHASPCLTVRVNLCHLSLSCRNFRSVTDWYAGPAYQSVTYTEWYIPDDVLIQLILLMMSTGLLETCREVK